MREEAFAEFHQVCYVVSQAFNFVLLLSAFSNSSGACCLKMQGGGGGGQV